MKIISIFLLIGFAFIYLAVSAANKAEQACTAKGGIEVRTPNGVVCAKVEVLP